MTDKVSPSSGHRGDAIENNLAARYGGGNSTWVPTGGDTPTFLATEDPDITESNLNGFSETSSTSSFDVTIDAGEGFHAGAWFVRDTSTTVTLASSTNNQTVYAGYDVQSGDTVTIGLAGTFGTNDPKTAIWEFDTDSNGVTSSTDKRTSTKTLDSSVNVDANTYKDNDIDTDGDGKVNSANDADNVTSTYKGNDIDSDGDGKVNSADSADSATDATNVTSTYKGNDIDSDGDGKVDSADDADNVTSTYKGNDIDSDGDGIVDNSNQVNGLNIQKNSVTNLLSDASTDSVRPFSHPTSVTEYVGGHVTAWSNTSTTTTVNISESEDLTSNSADVEYHWVGTEDLDAYGIDIKNALGEEIRYEAVVIYIP